MNLIFLGDLNSCFELGFSFSYLLIIHLMRTIMFVIEIGLTTQFYSTHIVFMIYIFCLFNFFEDLQRELIGEFIGHRDLFSLLIDFQERVPR